jgi:hypothetical protein
MQVIVWLIIGAVLGGGFVRYAYTFKWGTRAFLGYGLLAVATVYVALALFASPPDGWVVVEITGVALYGTIGLLGIRGSYWWLFAGWIAHPVWDVGLHCLGSGASFVPAWYAITCASFDVVVAISIVAESGRLPSP